MKTTLAILLSALIAYLPVQAQVSNSIPVNVHPSSEVPGKDTYLICILVLSACAAGGWLIWKAASSTCGGFECRNKRLILERSNYDGNWVPIATNDIQGLCTNWQEVFRTRMTDDTCCYRVHVTDIPPRYLTP